LSLPHTPAGPWADPIFEPYPAPERAPLPSPWKGATRNVLLFVLTVGSVYLHGGPRLVLALFSIMLAHEMGHYVACRIYRVDATLPYFLPLPVLSLVGTVGAFIRIRAPFPNRRALFDIGIAGPLAGFVVCLPVVVLGVREASLVHDAPRLFGDSLAEPLMFQWVIHATRTVPDGMTLAIGPLGMAAWFGLLLTALNLMPVGQLDGGHVVYALFRERAVLVSRLAWWACVAMIGFFGPSWILWAVLLRVIGLRHPPTVDDAAPLGSMRVVVALLGLLVFVVSFLPNPFLFSWSAVWELFTSR
jgi:membrane-associated protease RseP (regulator of RpoE activity)